MWGLALFLSALGIYAVLAYGVSQRTREIGVRGAIGASRGQIAALVLRQGLWTGGVGVAIGLVGAVLLSKYMTTLLSNVRPTDPAVYAAVSFVLIGVAPLASYLPARRAARIDPLVARCETSDGRPAARRLAGPNVVAEIDPFQTARDWPSMYQPTSASVGTRNPCRSR